MTCIQDMSKSPLCPGETTERPEAAAEDGQRPSLGFSKGASHSGNLQTFLVHTPVRIETETSSCNAVRPAGAH